MLGDGVLNRQAFKSYCEKHSYYHYSLETARLAPAGCGIFSRVFLPSLPGADETEKLNLVFASAPLWFLWFTHADVIGSVLGLKVVDLSSKSRYARPPVSFMKLPDGPFEWRRLPDGAEIKSVPGRGSTSERGWLFRTTSPRVSACVH